MSLPVFGPMPSSDLDFTGSGQMTGCTSFSLDRVGEAAKANGETSHVSEDKQTIRHRRLHAETISASTINSRTDVQSDRQPVIQELSVHYVLAGNKANPRALQKPQWD